MLKFFLRNGMLVDKVHDKISCRQSSWFKNIYISSVEKNQATIEFESNFNKVRKDALSGKTWRMLEIEKKVIQEDKHKEKIKPLSKLNFSGTHKPYAIYDSYTFKHNEVPMDKPIY